MRRPVAVLALTVVACGGSAPPAEPSSAARVPAPRTHTMRFMGPSMEPWLADGDAFTLTEDHAFERGDVVVYLAPDGAVVAKRVVAIGGDVVSLVDGVLHLGGVPVPTRALGPSSDADFACFEETLPSGSPYLVLRSADGPPWDLEPTPVPPGHVFVLGDHRDRSNDSRNPTVGPIPLERVAGRIVERRPSDGPRLRCPAS